MAIAASHRRSRRGLLTGALVPLALTACIMSAQRTAESDEAAADAYQKCENLRIAGVVKSHVASVDCAIPKVQQAYQVAAYPFMDLVYFSLEARQLGAERVDAGDVSDEQYQRDVAALDARVAAEEARRRNAMTLGGNAKPVPPSALVQGLPSFAEEARAAAPRPTPNGCVPLGGIRSCP